MKKINSVTGQIDANALQFTLMHEHLIVKPQINDPKYEPYTLDNPAKSTFEVIEYKTHGGKSIVDMTPINYGRNVDQLQKIGKASKTNILFTTGFHKEEFLPDYVADSTVDQLKDIIENEINCGVGDNHLKPSIIKCGSSFNMITDNEKKCIKAAAIAHSDTGLPISTHCDKGTMGKEQLELLMDAGVKPEHILLGHVDIPEDFEYLNTLCEMGVNIEIDHVGRHLDDHDRTRVEFISKLIKSGYIHQIFISGDFGKKDYLYTYGGKPGLTYFLKDLKESLSKTIGIRNYETIMIDNPKRFLSSTAE